MESALVSFRGRLSRLRNSASFVSLSSLQNTPSGDALDWYAVFGIQALSMISILSSTMVFSTAVFMVREWGAVDEAKAAAHAGLMIAAKPGFSALSSYAWGRAGDGPMGFRKTMLISAFVTTILTAALGTVTSFHWAVALRASTGFVDGVMTLTKSAMAKISNKTNSAKAFSTFGVTYGLGSSIGPTVAALLAYPCGGDPNASDTNDSNSSPLFNKCHASTFREYPFLLSTAWVGVLGIFLWAFAFLFMRIPENDSSNSQTRKETVNEPDDDHEIEMVSVAVVGSGGGRDEVAAKKASPSEKAKRGKDDTNAVGASRETENWATIEVGVDESDESESDGEDTTRLLTPEKHEKGKGKGDKTKTSSSDLGKSRHPTPTPPWHSDRNVRLATHAQVWCAFITITGAELTPIWMATSVENGGLGFSAVDIGTFGGIMGFIILVFAATLFSALANTFGVTTAVRWALLANGFIYLSHPLAWHAEKAGHEAVTWTMIVLFALGRGCAGPIVMGGVSLILNNSSPRKSLGAVNGFAGTFTNVARAAAPVFGGGLIAAMVHATRTLVGDGAENAENRNGVEFDIAETVPPTWWPFVLLSGCFFGLSFIAARLPRVLDAPRAEDEG